MQLLKKESSDAQKEKEENENITNFINDENNKQSERKKKIEESVLSFGVKNQPILVQSQINEINRDSLKLRDSNNEATLKSKDVTQDTSNEATLKGKPSLKASGVGKEIREDLTTLIKLDAKTIDKSEEQPVVLEVKIKEGSKETDEKLKKKNRLQDRLMKSKIMAQKEIEKNKVVVVNEEIKNKAKILESVLNKDKDEDKNEGTNVELNSQMNEIINAKPVTKSNKKKKQKANFILD